jgi:hypothetical protein
LPQRSGFIAYTRGVQGPAIDQPDFTAEVTYGDQPELRLVGTADTSVTEPLATLIATLHTELLTRKVAEIVVDVRALELMGASCFTELVAWLSTLQALPPNDRYRIRFRSNPTIAWQRRSLSALSCFDTDLVTIES